MLRDLGDGIITYSKKSDARTDLVDRFERRSLLWSVAACVGASTGELELEVDAKILHR